MNHDDAKYQARLEQLLAAVHAPADERILARARARIVAGRAGDAPVWLNWLGHPAAVAAAALICVACGVASVEVWNNAARSGGNSHTESPTLVSALLGDDGSDGMPALTSSVTAAARAGTDSGSVR